MPEASLLIVAVVLPLAAGMGALLSPLRVRRVLLIGTMLLLLVIAVAITVRVDEGTLLLYRLGDWPAPIAVMLAVDRLSAMMLVLTAVVALATGWHATGGVDNEAPYFHTLFLLQVAGLNGAFMAGDLFNLFVFFELLLIASYTLLTYGSTRARLQSGMHYVVLNLVGSTLFLLAIGLLYASTGTLNMADMAVQLRTVAGVHAPMARSGALLLLVVFGLKAALGPLSFWLPSAYTAAPSSIAALFALMTKVGVYAIIRVGTLMFGREAGALANVFEPWLLPVALLTIAVGAVAALSARALPRLTAALLIVSVGTMVAAAALFTAASLAGALYYLAHSTLAVAAMFLLAGNVRELRHRPPAFVFGSLFVAAVALAGLPPLAGFIGKVLILQAAPGGRAGIGLFVAILLSSAIAVASLSRVANTGRAIRVRLAGSQPPVPRFMVRHAPSALLLMIVALSLFARPATAYAARTAGQLVDPQSYIDAVQAASGSR